MHRGREFGFLSPLSPRPPFTRIQSISRKTNCTMRRLRSPGNGSIVSVSLPLITVEPAVGSLGTQVQTIHKSMPCFHTGSAAPVRKLFHAFNELHSASCDTPWPQVQKDHLQLWCVFTRPTMWFAMKAYIPDHINLATIESENSLKLTAVNCLLI